MATIEGWTDNGRTIAPATTIDRRYKSTRTYRRLKSGDQVEPGVTRWVIRSDNGVILDHFNPPGYN